jgi:hypothetical protein
MTKEILVPTEQEAEWASGLAWTLCGIENLLPLSGIEVIYLSCLVITDTSWHLSLPQLGEFPVHVACTSPRQVTLVVLL